MILEALGLLRGFRWRGGFAFRGFGPKASL